MSVTKYIASAKNIICKTWLNVFWKNPPHLWALKVTVSIAFLIISTKILFNNPFIGTTLALGVVAMALAETDVHPLGRLKSAAVSLVLFFLVSSIVELLLPYPLFFAAALVILFFSLTLLGGVSSRLQGVTFGAMLIFTYTMLGAGNSDKWFYQPILYTMGAICYSTISILLLYFRPQRLLRKELAAGFHYLGDYIELKANLFPSNRNEQAELQNRLAQKNIELAQQIELCKDNLYSYSYESDKDALGIADFYFRKWFLLQQMQERAISSHEQYDLLSVQLKNTEIMEGFGQLMRQLAIAMHVYADALLIGAPYKHPLSLKWTISALKNMLESDKTEAYYATLSLLMKNLGDLEQSLTDEDKAVQQIDVSDFNIRKPRHNSLKEILTPRHPRFRFSVRLTLCLLLGYGMEYLFHFEKGAWIMLTSLIVFQQTYSATRLRFYNRVFGTLMGVVLGVILANLLPTFWGQIVLLLGSIYAFFYWLKKNYIVAAIFITIFVLAAFNLLSEAGIAVMLPRIIDTLIGGILAFGVIRFVWTDWQYKQLPGLLLNAVARNIRYFQSVYETFVSEKDYLHQRRMAHNADNALAMAWKGMRLEPKGKKEKYQDKAFDITNLNHTLLSYISAFGVHRELIKLSETELDFCNHIHCILEFVSQLLTNNIDEEKYVVHLQSANQWVKAISELKTNDENEHITLIYNIAHVSRELLIEVEGIRMLYGK